MSLRSGLFNGVNPLGNGLLNGLSPTAAASAWNVGDSFELLTPAFVAEILSRPQPKYMHIFNEVSGATDIGAGAIGADLTDYGDFTKQVPNAAINGDCTQFNAENATTRMQATGPSSEMDAPGVSWTMMWIGTGLTNSAGTPYLFDKRDAGDPDLPGLVAAIDAAGTQYWIFDGGATAYSSVTVAGTLLATHSQVWVMTHDLAANNHGLYTRYGLSTTAAAGTAASSSLFAVGNDGDGPTSPKSIHGCLMAWDSTDAEGFNDTDRTKMQTALGF